VLLQEAERGKGCEGATAEGYAEDDTGEDVAKKVHTEDDAGECDAEGEKDEWKFEAWIKVSENERHGRGSHCVAGGE
jgi:hypothetical protein